MRKLSEAEAKAALMADMRSHVAGILVEIEDVFLSYGLPLSKITLIARDPSNDNMRVMLTNETESGLKHAVGLAMLDDGEVAP